MTNEQRGLKAGAVAGMTFVRIGQKQHR